MTFVCGGYTECGGCHTTLLRFKLYPVKFYQPETRIKNGCCGYEGTWQYYRVSRGQPVYPEWLAYR